MLKNVTRSYIKNCNAIKVHYSEYLILDGKTIPIKAKLNDDCYENGNFIGSFILKTISFETDSQYDFRQKEFEYYKSVNGESIKIGTFIATEVEINDTTEIVKVVAMDYGLKTQIGYRSELNYESGTVTLLDVWNEACELSGLQSGIENFTNSNFIVDSDQFTGTGATVRDVFMAIAMSSGNFVKVMNDDKIYLVFTNDTTDIIEDYTELEDKRDTHPWTCLRLGMSQIEGENVDYIDDELVQEYGENWLILNDNPFAYNQQKRQLLIENIFNQIKEFGYSAFVSKTSFKPYLTCGDVIKFRNRDGNLVNSIILRYEHNSENITLQAPSETSATVNYIYPMRDIDRWKRTEAIVDKNTGDITLLTQETSNIQTDLRENYYTSDKTEELVLSTKNGITNTFSEAGGNNIFRNTGLWFETTDNNNPYEFWNGVVVKEKQDRASNMTSMKLQNGDFYQQQEVSSGNYTVSFKYQKLTPTANITVNINDVVYILTGTGEIEFVQTIEVKAKQIKITFSTNINNSCEIYDLMVNAGTVKLAYSQNQNETTTDTVNISKGITITSSNTHTEFKADSDGIRIYDRNSSSTDPTTKFIDTGMETNQANIKGKSQIVKTLWQEVGEQTWITRL